MMLKQKGLGRSYQDGDIIIRQGTVGEYLYVIQEGTVEVVHERQDRQIKIAELGKSDFFGEMALFERDVRSCTVRAKGEVKILSLDRKTFYKTVQKDPSLAFRMLEKMSNRLRELDNKIL